MMTEDWTKEIRERLEKRKIGQGIFTWNDADEMTSDIARLLAEREVLREALSNVSCKCTIQEMMSGHKIDCYMPQIEEALAWKPEGVEEK